MDFFISFDGGGTKIDAIVFDECLNTVFKTTYDGGINPRTLAADVVEKNIIGCMEQIRSGTNGLKIKRMYGFFMHNQHLFEKHGKYILGCGDIVSIDEGVQGILCGGIYPSGVLLLCGTGSDAFVVQDGSTVDIIGGWGALLGDEGSGYSIGKAALISAVAYYEKRAKHTLLYDAVIKKYPAESFRKSVYGVYAGAEPVRAIADFAKDAEIAADKGDKAALQIFDDAAAALSQYVITAFNKHNLPLDTPVTFTGGILKHDISREKPLMLDRLRKILSSHGITNLKTDIKPAVFGGMIYHEMKCKGN